MPNLNHRFFGMSKGAGGTMNTRKKVFIACVLMAMSVSVKCDAAVSLNTGVKCVKLSSGIACDRPPESQLSAGGEFTTNCGGVAVTVISQCATDNAGSGAAVLSDDKLRMMVGGANANCWCKIISPVVSAWVPMGTGSSLCNIQSDSGIINETGCLQACASYLEYGEYNNMFFEHILW